VGDTGTVAGWLRATNGEHLKDDARDIARLGDGGWLSIQASRYHRCDPQLDNADGYRTVEIGFLGVAEGPSAIATRLAPYHEHAQQPKSGGAPLYAYVPLAVAESYVAARGGILS
jgi:hypothetical protein